MISAGVTDRIEIGAHVAYEDEESIKGGHLKVQVLRQDGTAFSVEATLLGTDGDEGAGMAAANLSTCLDRECGSVATLHGGVLYATDQSDDQVPFFGGASLVVGGGSFKFLSEAYSLQIDHERLIGGMFGMRISGRQFGFDLGVAFAATDNGGGALPVLGLTLRP
jgi:hypothetical protein